MISFFFWAVRAQFVITIAELKSKQALFVTVLWENTTAALIEDDKYQNVGSLHRAAAVVDFVWSGFMQMPKIQTDDVLAALCWVFSREENSLTSD